MLPCSSSYSATIRTGVLAWKNWRSRLSNHNDFWKQKIFGQFSFATVENFKTVWSNLTSQETALNLWTLFLLLPKNWLIIFFSEIVVIGQSFSNSGKLRHGPPKIQSKSVGEWSISEHLSIRKMRLPNSYMCGFCPFVFCLSIMQMLSRDYTRPENSKKFLNKNCSTFCCELLNRTGLGQCVMRASTKLCLAFFWIFYCFRK